MSAEIKKKVQSQFGQNAEAYATSTVHVRGASLSRIVELARPEATDRALDVATAAGHTAIAIAPRRLAMRRPLGRLARMRSPILGRDRLPGQALDAAQQIALVDIAERDGAGGGARWARCAGG